jgi:hypothetical protein
MYMVALSSTNNLTNRAPDDVCEIIAVSSEMIQVKQKSDHIARRRKEGLTLLAAWQTE